jgi:hypothetical protein
MSNTTTTRTTKSATTPAPKARKSAAPKPTPAPAQATPEVTVDDVQVTPTAYAIPAWDHLTGDASGDADRAAYASKVADEYRSADKATKVTIRSAWAKFQSGALNDLNMDALAVVRDVNAAIKSVQSRNSDAASVNPADAYVTHILALTMATRLASEAFAEAHGKEAWDAMTARVDAGVDGDEVALVETAAAKLAHVKVNQGNRRTGPARSVEAHIRSALAATTPGNVLTCSQIHNHRSDAYGPDESPSVGAIGAAHGRTMDGIESTTNTAGTNGFKLA